MQSSILSREYMICIAVFHFARCLWGLGKLAVLCFDFWVEKSCNHVRPTNICNIIHKRVTAKYFVWSLIHYLGPIHYFRPSCWGKQVTNRSQKYLYPQLNESYIDITWKATQQGRSHCSKTAIKNARLQFATAHGDFLEKCPLVWWSKNKTVWP